MPSRITAAEHKIASLADADIARVAAIGAPRLLSAVAAVSRRAIAHGKAAGDPRAALDTLSRDMPGVVQSAFVSSLVFARLLAWQHVLNQLPGVRTLKLAKDPVDEAVAALRRKLNVAAGDFTSLVKAQERAVAPIGEQFTASVRTRIERTVAKAIEQGATTTAGVDMLQAAFDRAGVTDYAPYQVETLFRTHASLAYAAGQDEMLADPVVDDALWGFKYVTVGDDRVRPAHIAMEGTTLPKDDPFWDSAKPPNGYNCRCQVIPIFDERKPARPPSSITVDGEPVAVAPDEGFAASPAALLGIPEPTRSELVAGPTKQVAESVTGRALREATPIADPSTYAAAWQAVEPNLTEPERNALRSFTTTQYGSVTQAQRKREKGTRGARTAERVESAIAKLPPLEATTWRGAALTPAELSRLKPGSSYAPRAILASTTNKSVAAAATDTSGGTARAVLFRVDGRTGKALNPARVPPDKSLTGTPGAGTQVLHSASATFDVVSVRQIDGQTVVRLREKKR